MKVNHCKFENSKRVTMPKWMTVAFALFLSLQVFSTQGKDVDVVIDNYIKAMGGKERLSSTSGYSGSLVDYALKGHRAELVSREVVAGRECYRLRLTLNSGEEIDFYIDSTSWLIVRKTTKKGSAGIRWP